MKRMIFSAAKFAAVFLATAFVAAPVSASSKSKSYEGPVIDMHVHAFPADGNGPPPLATCAGFAGDLRYDPATPWPQEMMRLSKDTRCEDPIWGAMTDDAVREETIAAFKRLNAIGVLSGTAEMISVWQDAAPGMFIAGRGFNVGSASATAEDIRAEYQAGGFEVLAEVTNQYSGVLADDPRFDAYWAVAAELDFPVGLHLGVGPPGAPHFYPDFLVQGPRQIEPILKRHPTLRVYLMHAGYPFTDELKAMFYLYPQLYVDTGVLQIATTRAEYYAFLEELVRAGFVDRVMFGSDQMNWPGLIEEGVDAINDAPFLTYEQKKAILHDNAARFLRLPTE